MLQPFSVAEATLDWFRRYVRTGFPLRDPSLDKQREDLIDRGLLWADPFVKLERPGSTGPKLAALADELTPETLALPWGFEHVYEHQARAIGRLTLARKDGPQNTLVLSGTGSGKTESFLIPIVDACLPRSQPRDQGRRHLPDERARERSTLPDAAPPRWHPGQLRPLYR